MKKNIIYAKSQYGGKKCVNEEYIECDDGEGSCPLDCKGEFTRCDSNCNKKFKVLVKEKNGGKSLIFLIK